MTQAMEHVNYLSREIGARTAGTDEERQAALYIADEFQSDSGFHTEIEDFVSSSNLDIVRPLCTLVVFVAGILALLFPFLCIPALILTLVAAALYITELLDKPIIPRTLAGMPSQNVVAKYQPNPSQGGRRKRTRKIVLVARYDTGNVRPGFDRMVRSLRLPIAWISIGAMGLAVLLVLIRTLFMANAAGFGALIFNIINIVVLIVAVVPAVLAFMSRRAGLNEGANNNATGVAALLEVARRISRGSLSEADLEDSDVSMHGEAALRDEGLVPEGAQMVYESEQLLPPDLEPQTPEERLAKAKAALAAFTGVPGARYEPTDIAEHLVDTRHGFAEPPAYDRVSETADEASYPEADIRVAEAPKDAAYGFSASAVGDAGKRVGEGAQASLYEDPSSATVQDGKGRVEPVREDGNIMEWDSIAGQDASRAARDDAGTSERFDNAPDWFVAAQKKARKSDEEQEVRPSRYGSAISAAERDIEQRAKEEQEAAAELERERLRESVAMSRALAQEAQEAQEAESAQAEMVEQGAQDVVQGAQETVQGAQETEQAGQETEQASQEGFGKPEPAEHVVEDTYVPIAVAALSRDEARASSYHQPAEPAPLGLEDLPTIVGGESSSDDARGTGDEGAADRAASADGSKEDAVSRSFGAAAEPKELSEHLEPQEKQGDNAAEEAAPAPRRRPIVLPDIGVSQPKEEAAAPAGGTSSDSGLSRSGMIRRLRTDIPSLSGTIAPVGAEDEPEGAKPAGRIGATGSFAPVGDELLAEAGEDDMYVDDADDSGIEENYTETGAYAGPDYVEMPKSRFGRLFGRKKKKASREALEESPQEWLDVDEEFDARQVGKKRGDWESFRPSDYEELPKDQPKERMRDLLHDEDDAYADDFDDFDDDSPRRGSKRRAPRGGRRWEGGAFSRLRLGRVGTRSGEEDEEIEVAEEAQERRPRRDEGAEPEEDMVPIEQIYHFRNPNFTTEVWFVAIGSDTRRHDGIKAFIEEHRADLRGALVLEVESLGAGELCVIQEEGLFRRQTASSRIRRLLKKTASAIGFEPGQATISNADSLTSVAVSKGVQTMHLAGMEGDWPALKGSAGDTIEEVDEELLLSNIDYITELVQRF